MLFTFAVQLVALLGFAALALNVGWLQLTRVRMQAAADAAALEAAYAIQSGSAQWQSAGQADAALNGFTNGQKSVTVTLNHPPTSGSYVQMGSAVQAVVQQSVNSLLLGWAAQTISAQATAFVPPNPCTFGLSPTSTNPPSFQAINATLNGPCSIYARLNYTLQTGSFNGPQLYVGGGPGLSSGTASPPAMFGAGLLQDPLSYVVQPQNGAPCTAYNQPINPGGGTYLIPVGAVYCGTTTINGPGTVQLPTGTTTFAGTLSVGMSGPAVTLRGSSSTVFITSYNGTYGAVNLYNINFYASAPRVGPLQGILLFVDRSLPSGQVPVSIAYGNGNGYSWDGIVYAPGQLVKVVSTSVIPNNYFGIVAGEVWLQNTNYLPAQNNYSVLTNGNPFSTSVPTLLE
jgi:hypothetical protein